MSRLFFALWPDPQVRAEIYDYVSGIPLENSRLVAESNTHITLAFLGNVDEETSARLIAAASNVSIAPFAISLDQIGWWRKPKIAWLAPSSYPDELSRLATDLHKLSEDCGVSMEARPYRPHLSFARKVTKAVSGNLHRPISWNINEFCLLESKSSRSGLEYQVKVRWPLKIM